MSQLPEYEVVCLDKGNPDLFYESRSMSTLAGQLAQVIQTEGPVSQAVVFKRVTRAWGLSRVGIRIEAHLSALVPRNFARTNDVGTTFYWPEHANPSTWEGVRVPGIDTEARRSIDEIALEELGNAAVYILAQHGGTSRDGLAKAVCRLLGVTRTTAEAGARISQALTHGRVPSVAVVVDGSVHLRK
ncbi:DUF3320 domain-containing protein [Pandoraea anhela]|uniref:DNA helicase n=1 Tax=Pandoraea anhela TaxID=2508295 RepID=A0A5E4ZAI8_9BURK|nr:DUF3320 domain-containing protein [Pandoraea anhela]VVE57330.1 DNA helicase [Pandoraea anhela]